jgi:hypothetical protein
MHVWGCRSGQNGLLTLLGVLGYVYDDDDDEW